MKGLIIKDLLNLKKQLKLYAIFAVLYFALAGFTKDAEFIAGVILVMFAMMPITAMSYDERAGWDKYALAMLISRNRIVGSKYLLGLMSSLVGAAASLGFYIILGTALREALAMSGVLLMVAVFWAALLLPIMFKMGTEKGRIVMMVGMLAPVFLIGFLSDANLTWLTLDMIQIAIYAAPIVLLIMVWLSYKLSVIIYRKKEL